jgi:hypothetical protein
MIGEKLERTALRKDGGLLMEGAVFETEAEFAGDPIPVRILDQTTGRENFATQVAKNEKAVNAAFDVTHRNLIRNQAESQEEKGGFAE